MRGLVFGLFWNLIEPELTRWLRERALNLGSERRTELARKLRVTTDTIEEVENALREVALAQVRSLRDRR